MFRVWNDQRGLTFTELMVTVVVLGLVAVPLTSIGTTAFRWWQADAKHNEMVLLAETKLVEAKKQVEAHGQDLPPDFATSGVASPFRWEIDVRPHVLDGEETEHLFDVWVTITPEDSAAADTLDELDLPLPYELPSLARRRE